MRNVTKILTALVLCLGIAGSAYGQKMCKAGHEVSRYDTVIRDAVNNAPVKGALVQVWDSWTKSWHTMGRTDNSGRSRGTYMLKLRWGCKCGKFKKAPSCFQHISFKTKVSHPRYKNIIVGSKAVFTGGNRTSGDRYSTPVHVQRAKKFWKKKKKKGVLHKKHGHKHKHKKGVHYHEGPIEKHQKKKKKKKKKKNHSRPGVEIKTKGIKAKITF